MQSAIVPAFESILRSYGLKSRGVTAVLAAVSGGRDSMCLLDLLHRSSVLKEEGVSLSAVHCNFHLRGGESDGDERAVGAWCSEHGVPLEVGHFDTLAYAKEKGISIEMAARDLRYGFFAGLLDGGTVLAVAHTAQDNAETLILNLVRGSGLDGLCGMAGIGPLPLPGTPGLTMIRPLLGFTREQVTAYVNAEGVPFRDDASNADTRFRRNLVRHEVMPALGGINPSLVSTLGATARHMRDAKEAADAFFEERLGGFCRTLFGADRPLAPDDLGRSAAVVVRDALLRQPAWRHLLYKVLSAYGFNSSQFDDVVDLLEGGGTFSGKSFLGSGGFVMETSRRGVEILPLDLPREPVGPRLVHGPGEALPVGGPQGREVLVSLVDEGTAVDYRNPPKGVLYMSSDKLKFPLEMRSWRAGDWMRPLGMGGRRRKLSDVFATLGLAQWEKDTVPLLCAPGSDEVLCIVGCRISERVKVDAGTEKVVGVVIRPVV